MLEKVESGGVHSPELNGGAVGTEAAAVAAAAESLAEKEAIEEELQRTKEALQTSETVRMDAHNLLAEAKHAIVLLEYVCVCVCTLMVWPVYRAERRRW